MVGARAILWDGTHVTPSTATLVIYLEAHIIGTEVALERSEEGDIYRKSHPLERAHLCGGRVLE
jgi:hypothetical protein